MGNTFLYHFSSTSVLVWGFRTDSFSPNLENWQKCNTPQLNNLPFGHAGGGNCIHHLLQGTCFSSNGSQNIMTKTGKVTWSSCKCRINIKKYILRQFINKKMPWNKFSPPNLKTYIKSYNMKSF